MSIFTHANPREQVDEAIRTKPTTTPKQPSTLYFLSLASNSSILSSNSATFSSISYLASLLTSSTLLSHSPLTCSPTSLLTLSLNLSSLSGSNPNSFSISFLTSFLSPSINFFF
ncbi:uncharacterized protein K444DRAFT_36068 [Hyaloscypha bicolor E]|uniref:Uncharacterized protein n=1 Tax=Hyaloscypha bicolor E TaxID=1095630 RepID=A0A2J6T1A9_9HELO|nr:uncharacterized protein K444DRAFT_36068 [Hyaloscypha bicolor E]PMD56808.1 hypothetical protein K444DRAFT_36068 [Hyaloscypha bicolor E]